MINKKYGQVIGVIAIKGGVGKTTIATNLAATLAEEYQKKVLLIDGNFSAPTTHLHVGVLNPEKTIHDILQAQSDPTQAIYSVTENLHIIPGTLEERNINPMDLHLYMKRLKERYDFIFIDASPNLNEEMIATINAADQLFVITTPDHVALSATLHAVKVARKRLTYVSGIIMNMVNNKNYELDYKTIEEITKTPVIGIINKDANFLKAVEKTIPYMMHNKKNTDAKVEYRKIAAAMTGTTYKDPRLIPALKSLFKKEISKGEINRTLILKSHY